MDTDKNINILNGVNYKMVFDRIPDVNYFTKSLGIPSVSTDSPSIPTPRKASIFVPGSQVMFDPFVLVFILDEDMRTYKEIYNWMIDSIYTDKPADIWTQMTVHVLSGNMNTKMKMKFVNIFPIDMDGVNFDSAVDDSELIEISVTFNYSYFYFEDDGDKLASSYTPIGRPLR